MESPSVFHFQKRNHPRIFKSRREISDLDLKKMIAASRWRRNRLHSGRNF
jgi:hypothetical protein